jgi:hypothetical protein
VGVLILRKSSKLNMEKIKWARPMSIEELSHIYNVHRNTMSKWLRDQVICNRHLSPRRWQIAKDELPGDDIEEQGQKS